jgi:hypothetical protein
VQCESLGKNFFVAKDFGGFAGIFLAAFIASNRQAPVEKKPRREGIGLPKRDSVPIKMIRWMMKSLIFADYHPAVWSVSHMRVSQMVPQTPVPGNQGCESYPNARGGQAPATK